MGGLSLFDFRPPVRPSEWSIYSVRMREKTDLWFVCMRKLLQLAERSQLDVLSDSPHCATLSPGVKRDRDASQHGPARAAPVAVPAEASPVQVADRVPPPRPRTRSVLSAPPLGLGWAGRDKSGLSVLFASLRRAWSDSELTPLLLSSPHTPNPTRFLPHTRPHTRTHAQEEPSASSSMPPSPCNREATTSSSSRATTTRSGASPRPSREVHSPCMSWGTRSCRAPCGGES